MSETERRRSSLRARRLCRFCLTSSEPLSDIYRATSAAAAAQVPLPIMVMACVAIEVFPSDGMPATICDLCRYFMDQSYRFKQICKQGDESLRQYIAQGDLRSPIEWPSDMVKNIPQSLMRNIEVKKEYNNSSLKKEDKSMKKPGVRSVGRPRKIPMDESIKKEEVKITIEDEDNLEPPTKIRVTQLGDDLVISTDENIESAEFIIEDDNASILDTHGKNDGSDIPTGVFPCPECQRSFPLQQLRDIHMQDHLRKRSHHCKECSSSFFNKYDLQKHELTHFGEKPFQCTVCNKSFHRATMLRRHEKLHTSVPKYTCSECDQTFLSQEILALHFKRKHERKRDFACTLCPKKFAFKQGLDRHFMQHKERSFKCNYCELRFNTRKQLIRHVQSHAGMRPHPCKFCPKSFILSHHYTRHLRTSHLNQTKYKNKIIKTEGIFPRIEDNYKCVECDEIFTKQDDLIFHSAIHATQNLTCPICKEKFQDVDGVTDHIKSHVDGEQFMCEWCDLVFTSEEKLDMHIDSEHQEAMSTDAFNEISYLEGKLIGESEVADMNDTSEDSFDEEDELYDSTQQSEAKKQAEIQEQQSKESEVEIEVAVDNDVKINILEVDISMINSAAIVESVDKVTYTELKTVDPVEIVKTVPDVVQKTVQAPTKTSILMRAEEVKKHLVNKSGNQKSTEKLESSLESSNITSVSQKVEDTVTPIKPPLTLSQRISELKEKMPIPLKLIPKEVKPDATAKEIPSRTNEKSLKLLEKDLMELKKVATSGASPDRSMSGRFPSFKSASYKRDPNTNGRGMHKPLFSKRVHNESRVEKSFSDRDHKKIVTSTPLPSSTKPILDDDSMMSDNSEDMSVRRSTRPSKVKNYAALVRDQEGATDIDDSDYEQEEEEEKEDYIEKEYKHKPIKQNITVTADGVVKRKRGRPRKHPLPDQDETPIQVMTPLEVNKVKRKVGRPSKKEMMERAAELGVTVEELKNIPNKFEVKSPPTPVKRSSEHLTHSSSRILETPKTNLKLKTIGTSQMLKSSPMLKKVTADMVKILPPGIKPLPLPPEAGAPPGVCQMRIGEKVVRVQKIVMSKAEVDAITKKGLVEIKDGAMVLKAGVKLPTTGDTKAIKTSLLSNITSIDKSQEISSPGPSSVQTVSASSISSAKSEVPPKPTRFGGNSPSDDEND